MVNLFKKVIFYLIVGLLLNSAVYSEDSFFDDEVIFEDSDEGFDEWSDDSDIFGEDELEIEKPFFEVLLSQITTFLLLYTSSSLNFETGLK